MTNASILILQHAAAEGPGVLGRVLRENGFTLRTVLAGAGEPVPRTVGDASALVLLGGPQGAYESARYPYLRDELRLIEASLDARIPILGICLGSQLLAAALGARVARSARREIGWFPVRRLPAAAHDPLFSELEASFPALHWHGDEFALPAGSIALATSERTPVQAFAHDRHTYGLLFHLEVTRAHVETMVAEFTDELVDAGVDAHEILDSLPHTLPAVERIGESVFGNWARLVSRTP